jgi:hypothetical protein
MRLLLRASGLHGLVCRKRGLARLQWVPGPTTRVSVRCEGRAGASCLGGECAIASGEARAALDAAANGLNAVHRGGAASAVGADDGRAAGEAARAGLHVALLTRGAVVAPAAGAVGSLGAAGAAATAGYAVGATVIGGIVLREGAAVPERVLISCNVGANEATNGGGGGLGSDHP